LITVGHVVEAGGVVNERLITISGVVAGDVVIEGTKTIGRVEFAIGVIIERSITVGSVVVADCVVGKCISASVVRLTSTPIPSPLLEPGMLPPVSGTTACTIGASPKQASTSGMRRKTRRKEGRRVGLLAERTIAFI
jgi:hypothetical protein